jgi:hypothetical protein
MGQQRKETSVSKMARGRRAVRRGRPPKFGRPSQLVALTLPQDVLHRLRTVHQDPAWAIVQLVESMFRTHGAPRPSKVPTAIAELVHLPGKRGLIVVQPKVLARLRGVSTIPLADGRAFLAFDSAAGLADLEVALLDRLEATATSSADHARLRQVLEAVRGWRRDRNLVFRTKSIIVMESAARAEQGSLGRLHETRRNRR